MTTFAQATINQSARTENGMLAQKSTSSACVDLFYNIAASRGKNIIPQFTAALVENKEYALRILQWVRDVRGGAGERELFRQVLSHLEHNDFDSFCAITKKVPELGRWDDLLIASTDAGKVVVYQLIKEALLANNALTAKWLPRQGKVAAALRNYLGWSPKFYRKTLVNLSKTVEQKMCAKEFDSIEFSRVPSLAHARYKKAFNRNTTKYAEYVAALVKGDDPKVKVNAGAVFPYDVIKTSKSGYTEIEKQLIVAQWDALPNLIGDKKILPMVDVSGSMQTPAGRAGSTTCLDVAVSLGLYMADKNKGDFKDTFLTFSSFPELLHIKGDIVQKLAQMVRSKWGMTTNLHAALDIVLQTAINASVPQENMPEMLLILSDMQFDQCVNFDDTAYRMMQRKYADVGYDMPNIVFWNLNARGTVPVSSDASGVALVSGFSPAILTSLVNAEKDEFSPLGIMTKTIMSPRYDI